jgi:hypothetical protein
MYAKLLDFYGIGTNNECIVYFFINSKGEYDTFKYDIKFTTYTKIAFIIGAQASMSARNISVGIFKPEPGFKL